MNTHLMVKWKNYDTLIIGKIIDIKCGEKYITIQWQNENVYKGEIMIEIDKLASIIFKNDGGVVELKAPKKQMELLQELWKN